LILYFNWDIVVGNIWGILPPYDVYKGDRVPPELEFFTLGDMVRMITEALKAKTSTGETLAQRIKV